ncbi:amino acid/amide ABC transporter ATP-binding protein 1, HAAT family [Methylobacillus rhizosphaerae]|uniref:Amino acid/amide ABC transporter ATP-binding protein 1, HAAT family n=1 Tax=Methylobacillus rhizosphaerae TaxID=551994 RepID=A0A238ZMA0_9PROT|nr:ABC transporter ATP-binding protein [Methylobacillus rhizosphaerae]SNR83834.1 amino acid/amide ABC transporter ATP-binding protein 1, HAAT family [Methylobacillus rhizosphaerae]
MTAHAPLLELQHISLSFKGIKAITDISFAVQQGEICALIGPNGAGKSSLLNVINGVYQPDEGVISFNSKSYSRMKAHQAAVQGIARTFQNIALFKGMSVLDNVLTGRNLKVRSNWLEQMLNSGRAPADYVSQRIKAEEVIDFLRINQWRNSIVGTLPYGLQKRVELARALASEPRLLLLDEPMAGMNNEEKAEMSAFILDTQREFGTTVVLIEHDIGVVMNLSGHVVVLDYGKKVGDGTPDEVRHNPEVIAAYLGTKH